MYKLTIATISARTGEIITFSSVDYSNINEIFRVFNNLVKYYVKLNTKMTFKTPAQVVLEVNENIIKRVSIEEVD